MCAARWGTRSRLAAAAARGGGLRPGHTLRSGRMGVVGVRGTASGLGRDRVLSALVTGSQLVAVGVGSRQRRAPGLTAWHRLLLVLSHRSGRRGPALSNTCHGELPWAQKVMEKYGFFKKKLKQKRGRRRGSLRSHHRAAPGLLAPSPSLRGPPQETVAGRGVPAATRSWDSRALRNPRGPRRPPCPSPGVHFPTTADKGWATRAPPPPGDWVPGLEGSRRGHNPNIQEALSPECALGAPQNSLQD